MYYIVLPSFCDNDYPTHAYAEKQLFAENFIQLYLQIHTNTNTSVPFIHRKGEKEESFSILEMFCCCCFFFVSFNRVYRITVYSRAHSYKCKYCEIYIIWDILQEIDERRRATRKSEVCCTKVVS